jgi:hypothetical protein
MFVLFIAALLCADSWGAGFVPIIHRYAIRPTNSLEERRIGPTSFGLTTVKTTSPSGVRLRKSQADASEKRGLVLFAIATIVAVWLFTIPVEIRRAHIGTADVCVQNRAYCYDCKTLQELKGAVLEYYANGGGIKFDFSVEPKRGLTRAQFVKVVKHNNGYINSYFHKRTNVSTLLHLP